MAKNEMEATKTCFVIGQFGKEGTEERDKADTLLEYIIKLALEPLGYKVFRADEVDDPGTITNRLIIDTKNSDLVVADLTDHNANAFYELGIRHTVVDKPTIHMIADDQDPPFDVMDQRIIKYNLSNPDSHEKARNDLIQKVKATLKSDYQVQNPVTQAIGFEELQNTGDPKDALIASIVERVSKLEDEQRMVNTDLIRNEIRTNVMSHSLGFGGPVELPGLRDQKVDSFRQIGDTIAPAHSNDLVQTLAEKLGINKKS